MDWADRLAREGVLRTPVIIEAFRAILREDFVPEAMRADARRIDAPLPIGFGQTISQPWTVAFMLELLQPRPGQKILDVGAGSGWQSALLAYIVSQQDNAKKSSKSKFHKTGKVFAIERVSELCGFGRANVAKYAFIENKVVEWACRDATDGIPDQAPFDRIIAAAGAVTLPLAWREQCVIGGIIVAPIGGSIWKFTKAALDQWEENEYPGFAFVPFVSDADVL